MSIISNKTVLVVDDIDAMRRVIAGQLDALGATKVHTAANGADALRILARQKVDLVLSDWNMPRMKGIDLLRRVRGDDALAGTPFIMLTAEALASNVIEADAAKVSSYLVKPFTADELWRVLEDSLIPDHPVA